MGKEHSTEELIQQLEQMGYLPQTSEVDGPAEIAEVAKAENAIRMLQRNYHLEETGVLGPIEEELVFSPGCGVPDPVRMVGLGLAAPLSGKGKWSGSLLTYRFVSYIDGIPHDDQEHAFRRAFDTWQDAFGVPAQSRPLTFEQVSANADIVIKCASGNHGDDWPFGGKSNALAHAFYPYPVRPLAGDIHIDTARNWSVATSCPPDHYDLETVALHEIGHSIGLAHNSITSSVMYRAYRTTRRRLIQRDKDEIRQLYSN